MAYSYISKVRLPNGETTYYIKDQYGRTIIGGSAYNDGGYIVGDYVIDTVSAAVVSDVENASLYRCTKSISKIRPTFDPYPT